MLKEIWRVFVPDENIVIYIYYTIIYIYEIIIQLMLHTIKKTTQNLILHCLVIDRAPSMPIYILKGYKENKFTSFC